MFKDCYKLVLKEYDYFTSINFSKENYFYLTYHLDKITYPKIGKIFVFDTIESCKDFKDMNGSFKSLLVVLKGFATDISFPKYRSDIRFIESFWENKRKHKKLSSVIYVPKGTMLCSSFLPIEIVK